ncbi:MAG: glycosyltransferase [Calditrichaeota bacterium]|nr:MAG: glycosyltransferase [Calditrichota bacterium]
MEVFSVEPRRRKKFYFDRYEHRTPPPPIPYSAKREMLWQFLATINLVLGGWYIYWRWAASLNPDALWFAIPLAWAETMAFIGLILFTFNLWKDQPVTIPPPPRTYAECIRDPRPEDHRPLNVDVFFPTYDEDPELVRLSILDAKKIRYPYPIHITIHVLDDGRREEMKQVAMEEGVNYITRENNIGFKAGNLRNAMEQTYGDFIVICDADTRPFPTILEHTLGFFRDPDMAWVQTPQWFYDIPEGKHLRFVLQKYLKKPGYWIGAAIEKIFGPIKIGEDPFVNDPKMFYDMIQRRRNWCNASFCCGAGSVHRREAVMEAALKTYADAVDGFVRKFTDEVLDEQIRADLEEVMKQQLALETEITPYKFHVSEDIYTSIVLHSDPERNWKSWLQPLVESKMLSPQDLYSWAVQRFKYAGGTLDIARRDNPIFKKGLTIPQKLMYGMTIWSYLGALWNVIFLFSPVFFLFTGISPVSAYSMEFYKHILPFLIMNEIAFMVGTWGAKTWDGKASYLSFFPINLRAIWTVLKGERIKFPVTPKDRQEGNFFHLVIPQFLVMVLSAAGIIYALIRYKLGYFDNLSGLLANTFWCINNMMAMFPIVRAAFWKPDDEMAAEMA